MDKLSKEQSRLVEENYPLVWWFMGKKGLSQNNHEDWHGLFSAEMCRCAKKYDPSLGVKFSAYVAECFQGIYTNEITKQSKSKKVVSADAPIFYKEDADRGITLLDKLVGATNQDNDTKVCLKDAYTRALDRVKPCRRDIVREYIESGGTMVEIARRRGVSKQYVSRAVQDFTKKIKIVWNGSY